MTNPDYRAMCAELIERLEWFIAEDETNENDPGNQYWLTGKQAGIDSVARARALLAQPVAEGPSDEEIEEWADACPDAPVEEMDPEIHGWRRCFTAKEFSETIRAALARWGRPTPQPVAVSERLPGPEDCLDEGWAWFFNKRIGWRQAVLPVSTGYTHWLPAKALPTPEAQ